MGELPIKDGWAAPISIREAFDRYDAELRRQTREPQRPREVSPLLVSGAMYHRVHTEDVGYHLTHRCPVCGWEPHPTPGDES